MYAVVGGATKREDFVAGTGHKYEVSEVIRPDVYRTRLIRYISAVRAARRSGMITRRRADITMSKRKNRPLVRRAARRSILVPRADLNIWKKGICRRDTFMSVKS